jgi:ATP-dependent DNA helicase RecG
MRKAHHGAPQLPLQIGHPATRFDGRGTGYRTQHGFATGLLAPGCGLLDRGHSELPDSLTPEQIRTGVSNRRNRVLAEHAAHILPYRGLGTGVPRALGAWPKIDLVDEREANQLRTVWRVAAPQVTPEVLSLLVVMQGEMQRADIQSALGLKDREHFRAAYLVPAITGGFVEMTVPDKPQSSLQRYRLTAAGQACQHSHASRE